MELNFDILKLQDTCMVSYNVWKSHFLRGLLCAFCGQQGNKRVFQESMFLKNTNDVLYTVTVSVYWQIMWIFTCKMLKDCQRYAAYSWL